MSSIQSLHQPILLRLLGDILFEDISVSWLSISEILQRLSSLLHRSDGDPRSNVLLNGQLKHLEGLSSRSEERSTDEGSVLEESEGSELWPGILWETDEDDVSSWLEGGEDLVEWEGGGRGGDEDHVELSDELLVEALVLGSCCDGGSKGQSQSSLLGTSDERSEVDVPMKWSAPNLADSSLLESEWEKA